MRNSLACNDRLKKQESNFQWPFHNSPKSKQIFQMNVFLFVRHIFLLLELLLQFDNYYYLNIFIHSCLLVLQ